MPEVSVYWGRTDAGDDVLAWESSAALGPQAGEFAIRLSQLLPETNYFVRVAAANSGGRTWTDTFSITTLPAPPLRISEFMAANGTIARSRTRPNLEAPFDKTLKSYDWIELHNSLDQPYNVGGYHLTDTAERPTKWQFPADTFIPPRGYLLVYASGEDIQDPSLDENGRLHTNFQLSSAGEYLALSDTEGQLISELDTDLPQYRDVSYGVFNTVEGHMRGATPGAANEPLGASVTDVRHQWKSLGGADQLVVTARVGTDYDTLTDVLLHYRVMYDGEISLPMHDDGRQGDAVEGDGIFSAFIPGDAALPGQMIRYYVTAALGNGLLRREPMFVDPLASPEYFGTMQLDSTLDSNLPVIHRFAEEPRRVDGSRHTQVSIYYLGELYDNVRNRIRGGTARSWPKKSYKLEFNDDHQFVLNPAAPRVDEVDLNTTYTDKSYLRARLTSDFLLDAGLPSPETYHVRMQQNGEFFSIAFMIEQPDRDFLRRHGLDPEGSFYKAGPGATYAPRTEFAFEKKTRDDEDKSDLQSLLDGLQLSGDELEQFVFDNVDLATQINFMATVAITQNIDASDKNHFLFRDTNGTGEWHMLPWDLDLVFGPDALNTDYMAADQNTQGATYPNASHPLIGSREFPLHAGKVNLLQDSIITTPRTREMLLRRIRTLADEFLATGYFHDQIDEWINLLSAEVPLDREKWGNNAHFGAVPATPFETAAEQIKQQYLDRRLPYLTDYHVNQGIGIPEAQPDTLTLPIGQQMAFDPPVDQPGDEYFTVTNPYPFAVDVSGWQIVGATTHTLKAGTVIGPNDALYLTRNAAGFRARSQSPTGAEGRFVQQYEMALPRTGGQLQLLDETGRRVSEVSYGNPVISADASNLRIAEIAYHPTDGNPSWGELLADGNRFEFVEVTNIASSPIEMAGVHFVETIVGDDTQGIVFQFDSQVLDVGQSLVVAKDVEAFRSRYGGEVVLALGDDGLGGRPGEYANRLGNGGETITLNDTEGRLIQQLSYTDEQPWPSRADGTGSSLEWQNTQGDPGDPAAWQSSELFGGSPGMSHRTMKRDVVINEILANSEVPQVDQIELLNTTDETIDISGWYLSDSGDNPLRYQIPATTVLPPGGFLVVDQTQFLFNLRGDSGDDAYLIAADAAGRPMRFADYVRFGPTMVNATVGRYPDGTGAVQPLISPSLGGPNHGPVVGLPGDFNLDGTTDGADLRLLCLALPASRDGLIYDLNDDQLLDHHDLQFMVGDILKTVIGDANLDGRFDSTDLLNVGEAGTYENEVEGDATWSTGDWNCDGEFDTDDVIEALAAGHYSR